MVFNSYEFVLLYMPIFTIGYYIIRNRGQKKENEKFLCDLWIILGSLVFFAFFGIENFAILLISLIWNFCTSIPMSFMRDGKVSIKLFGRQVSPHKPWLILGIAGNLILLLFFKLSGIFFPIAISFYTFNQISYIVDLSRGEIEKFDPMDYLAYVLFFPKLLQGPLMGYVSFSKELEVSCKAEVNWEQIMRALLLFSIGLFKKVLLADTFGKAVDFAYQGLPGLGSLEAILTAVFYSFQLYFDFSGYCDMAFALCMMMGLELSVNFDSPYRAVNIVDFWKRWHITLTKFFTKYIYIPLGGNRKGALFTYINLMVVFLISGFWHGTGWTFIIWGAMHGVLYVITRALGSNAKKAEDEKEGAGFKLRKFFKTLLTFVYVTAAWVFFRASTVQDALMLFTRMFTGGRRKLATGFSSCFQLDEFWYVIKVTPLMKLSFAWDICLWGFLIAAIVMIFFNENAIKRVKECKIGVWSTLLTAILLIWSVVSFGGVSTFLYMNF